MLLESDCLIDNKTDTELVLPSVLFKSSDSQEGYLFFIKIPSFLTWLLSRIKQHHCFVIQSSVFLDMPNYTNQLPPSDMLNYICHKSYPASLNRINSKEQAIKSINSLQRLLCLTSYSPSRLAALYIHANLNYWKKVGWLASAVCYHMITYASKTSPYLSVTAVYYWAMQSFL